MEALWRQRERLPTSVFLWEPIPEIAETKEFQKSWKEYQERFAGIGIGLILLPTDTSDWSSVTKQPTFPKNLEVFVFPPYVRSWKRDWTREIQRGLGKVDSNVETIHHFSRTWTRNYLQNWKSEKTVHFVQGLELSERGLLFLGASPELEDSFLEIRSLAKEGKHILLASDSSLGYLLRAGILPDAVLSMDPGRGTLFHFSSGLPKEVPILTWFGALPYLFGLPNPLFVLRTSHPLDQWTGQWLQEAMGFSWIEIPNPGGNPANLAQSLARLGMAREFTIAGVSFRSLEGKSHCRGTGYESYFLPKQTRLTTWEGYNLLSYKEKRQGKNQVAWEALQTGNPKPQALPRFVQEPSTLHKQPWLMAHGLPVLPGVPSPRAPLPLERFPKEVLGVHGKALGRLLAGERNLAKQT